MRNYSSITPEFTLASDCLTASTTLDVTNADITPAVPFTLVLNPDTVKEEIVTVTAIDGLQFTVSRAEEGTSPAKDHIEGEKARHMITGRDMQEAQEHIANVTDPHGITNVDNLVYTTEAQDLTNKKLISPKINENVVLSTTSTELNYVAGVTSAIQTQLDASKIGTRTVYVQPAEPTSPAEGDIWFQTSGA